MIRRVQIKLPQISNLPNVHVLYSCLSFFYIFTTPFSVGQDLRDDTTTSVDPDHWYRAANHWEEILGFVQSFQGPCDLHCVDVFSASRAIAKAFKKRFYRACSWDIKLSTHMDIVTESGCYDLLGLCLRLNLGLVGRFLCFFFLLFAFRGFSSVITCTQAALRSFGRWTSM